MYLRHIAQKISIINKFTDCEQDNKPAAICLSRKNHPLSLSPANMRQQPVCLQ
jgi:hypothetical protein